MPKNISKLIISLVFTIFNHACRNTGKQVSDTGIVLYYANYIGKDIHNYSIIEINKISNSSRFAIKYKVSRDFKVEDSLYYFEKITNDKVYRSLDSTGNHFEYLNIKGCSDEYSTHYNLIGEYVICYLNTTNDTIQFIKSSHREGVKSKLLFNKDFILLEENYISGYVPHFKLQLLTSPPIKLKNVGDSLKYCKSTTIH